jgi:hypothetical protein
MIVRVLLVSATIAFIGCEKDKRPTRTPDEAAQPKPAKPDPAAEPRVSTPEPPKPGRIDLVLSGAIERTVQATGATCDDDDSGAWVRSTDVDPTADPTWALSYLPARGVMLYVGTWDTGVSYQTVDNGGAAMSDGVLRFDAELLSETGAKVSARGELHCQTFPKGPVPDAIVDLLRSISGREPRMASHYDFGRAAYAGAVSVIEPETSARALVAELRAKLPTGWVAYYGTTRWLGDEKHDGSAEVVVGPGASQLDILRLARSDGVNHGLSTDAIVKRLGDWDATYGIDIFHAETDTIELELKTLPADMTAFAQELYAFCPDIVDQGVGSVAKLAESVKATREIYLWWD